MRRTDERAVLGIELEGGVCAGCHDDLVLAARPDRDDRDAGWLDINAPNPRDVDALRLSAWTERTPCESIPTAPIIVTSRAGTGRRNRLVCALPAIVDAELAAKDGLPGSGKAVGDDHEVDVDGATTTTCPHRRQVCTGH